MVAINKKHIKAESLRVEPTRDLAFIDSIIRHPDVYYASRDDKTPPINQITFANFIADQCLIFLRITQSKIDCGLFSLEACGTGYIGHACLLPNCRGAKAIAAGKLSVAWVFKHTRANGIISHCWETRPHVLLFAKRIGFLKHSTIPWPNRVNGAQIFSHGIILTRSRWMALLEQQQ